MITAREALALERYRKNHPLPHELRPAAEPNNSGTAIAAVAMLALTALLFAAYRGLQWLTQ